MVSVVFGSKSKETQENILVSVLWGPKKTGNTRKYNGLGDLGTKKERNHKKI